jgi:DNA-binding transcriptional LysR family regulator
MLSARHEIFMEVAAAMSFSRASQVLFISQPAISKHIKALEQYYKQSLFERKGNNIRLTTAGSVLYEHLKNAKKIQADLEFELSTLVNKFNARGELKLGASTTVALYIIPKLLSGFHQKYPGIMISLLNRNTDTIVKALLNEEIDIGIVEGKKKMSTIIYQPFMSDEVVAVCSSNSEIAKKRSLTIKEFMEKPVALREQGSGTLEAVKDCFEKNGIKMQDLKAGIRLAGTEALKNFIREDDCIGFLPKGSIKRELKDGDLVSIRIEKIKIERNFFFIQRQGTQNNELNRSFIRFCKQHI